VGIGYYGNTDTTWVQVMLTDQFGVDCARISWVASQQEQVPGRETPGNVERLGEVAQTAGTDALPSPALGEMLISGEIDAVVYGVPTWDASNPNLRPLLKPVALYELEWWRHTSVFPILHTVVVRESVADRFPELPRMVFEAFLAAKRTAIADPMAAIADEDLRAAAVRTGFTPPVDFALGADPFPYGLDANRANLAMLIAHAVRRGVIDAAPDLEKVFVDVGSIVKSGVRK
jgi:4,5-dihydroxyphthalate decarboxylase